MLTLFGDRRPNMVFGFLIRLQPRSGEGFFRRYELMNVLEQGRYPSFEEGWPRRSSRCSVTLRSARPGRSNVCCHETYDLPRCALIKVARPFFVGRSDPSSKEGKTLRLQF